MPRPPHETRLRVRYGETDQMGVAHHANYLLYFEEGRTRMMAERGCSYAELERRGVGLPVRKVELRYRAPARFDEELLVETRVARLGAASVTLETRILRADDRSALASGQVELACIDLVRRERGPIPLPADLRRTLSGAQ